MANRAQKRKLEKQNKNNKSIKKLTPNKKSFLKDKLDFDNDMISFVKTLTVVIITFLVILGITLLLNSLGVFDEGYTKPETQVSTISYEEILIGSVFSRPESEYYVVIGDFSDKIKNFYLINKLSNYTEDAVLYKVDMAKGVNKNYISEEGNYSANNATELKIKDPTLIKIKDGHNILYIEGAENIVNELFK